MRRTIFIFLAIVLIFSLNQSRAEESGKSGEQPKLVTAIEVKGNKSISTNVIVSKMKTRIGSPYQENIISDDLKRLYLLGFFSDVKIDTEEYKDGLKVVVTVVERPIIEKINFTGIRRLIQRDEKIKEQLKSKETQYLDYPSLTEDVRTIKKMYEKIGFSAVLIDYKLDVNPQTNKATVNFIVTEGQKIRIKDIIIEGNKAFTSAHILKLLKTKRAWFFNAGALKDDVLKEDIERIKGFYRLKGYTDVAVDYEIKADEKKPYLLNIMIRINEGKKYLVGNVTVAGFKDIPEKEILAALKECLPGNVFSEEALKYDVMNIQSLYFDRGYISCTVQDTTSLNPSSGRVDIAYSIAENQVTYVDKVKVKGNVKTKDIVIRRELRIRPGDKFDGEKLRRSKEKLKNLGFFEEVNYDTEDTQVADKKDLVVEVKESKTGAFSFGGGYSTVDALVGFIEVEQKNFDWKNWPYFTGDGQDLKFRASFGSISDGFDLSFTEPWVFDYPVSFGFDAYKQSHDRDEDAGYGYSQKVIGGDLRLGRELSDYWKIGATLKRDEITISDVPSTASPDLLKEVGKNTISSITPGVSFDSRDNAFDTRKGDLLSASFQYAGSWLGGTKDFWKFYGRGSHYIPLPWNSALEFKLRVGLAEPTSDTNYIPIYERFFAGGSSTIRGYEERMAGPVDLNTKEPLGGDAMIVGNIEYTYPLFDFLKVAGFFDIGNVWDKIGDIGASNNYYQGIINTGGLKKSFGLGLRMKTPFGPISVDYGIPLDAEPGKPDKSSGRFHFSASHDF
jgi:outer membrane protein insertion porin family